MAMKKENMRDNSMSLVLTHLNERDRRWVAGLLAECFYPAGWRVVMEKTGMDRKTIWQGELDIKNKLKNCYSDQYGQIRKEGGGRTIGAKNINGTKSSRSKKVGSIENTKNESIPPTKSIKKFRY